MISFRTHVVTLVAVFLALAVGVVLGGGPLSELGRSAETDTAELEQQLDRAEARAAFGERFAGESAAALYRDGLDGREVAILTFPGARQAVIDALREEVDAAGGSVSVVQPVGTSLVNPGEKSLVDTLGSQLMAQLPRGTITDGATTYERAGQLLGLTVGSRRVSGELLSPDTQSVADGLKGANLIPEVADHDTRAPLVLAVLGDEVTGDGADEIVGGLVRGFTARAVGVVVAQTTSNGSDQLDRLREEEALGSATSVDGVETVAGQVATVAALVRALDTQGGAFGATGSDGTVPLG